MDSEASNDSTAFPKMTDARNRQALNRQQATILAGDIETFRQLYATYKETPTEAQGGLLYQSLTQLLARMDTLVETVLLGEKELNQFLENKAFLGELSFQFASEGVGKRSKAFAGHGGIIYEAFYGRGRDSGATGPKGADAARGKPMIGINAGGIMQSLALDVPFVQQAHVSVHQVPLTMHGFTGGASGASGVHSSVSHAIPLASYRGDPLWGRGQTYVFKREEDGELPPQA